MDVRKVPLWTALVTPLNRDFSLDDKSLTHVLTLQQRANLGLLMLGSTGESLNLGMGLKKKILEQVIRENTGLPIMVGVPGHDLTETLAWLDYLETLPIHAYLMLTPIYARAGDEGQFHWFTTLMDRVSRPVMLYNIPKRCGSSLSLRALQRLQEHPRYWSVKEASGSVAQFKEYVAASNNQPIYGGDDGLFADFAAAGSAGLISVASNVWPLGIKLFVEQCMSGTLRDAALWQEAFTQLFQVANPVGIKRLLALEKHIQHATMMPPLSEADFVNCDALQAVSKQVHTWTQQYI